MPKLVIAVRQSPDWATIERDTFLRQSREFCANVGLPLDMIEQYVGLWDRTFRTPYIQTRERMKQIAAANWASVAGAQILTDPWTPEDLPDDAWIAFVDDDDWFKPDIATLLPATEDLDGVIWQHSRAGWTDEKDAVTIRPETGYCYTNNYAVSARYLKDHGLSPVFKHLDANDTFKSIRIKRLAQVLSMTNKHGASAMFFLRLWRGERPGLLEAVVEYTAQVADPRCPTSTLWSLPLIIEVRDHFVSLCPCNRG
jgi:hypothetical protein